MTRIRAWLAHMLLSVNGPYHRIRLEMHQAAVRHVAEVQALNGQLVASRTGLGEVRQQLREMEIDNTRLRKRIQALERIEAAVKTYGADANIQAGRAPGRFGGFVDASKAVAAPGLVGPVVGLVPRRPTGRAD